MADYFIIEADESEEFCALYDFPEEMEDIEMPADGTRMGSRYEPQTFRMADEVPGLVIPDVINNAFGYLMVSTRLKALMAANAEAEIEYLPFTVQNHKGRPGGEGFIVNVIGTSGCVDLQKTEGLPDPVNEGWLMSIDVLYLNEDRVDPKAKIFRIDVMPSVIIVRDDLRRLFDENNVTGVRYLRQGEEIAL